MPWCLRRTTGVHEQHIGLGRSGQELLIWYLLGGQQSTTFSENSAVKAAKPSSSNGAVKREGCKRRTDSGGNSPRRIVHVQIFDPNPDRSDNRNVGKNPFNSLM
jgi:hypothetical protein